MISNHSLKSVFILLCLIITGQLAIAQCTPIPSFNDSLPGLYPDNFEKIIVQGEPYTFDFQFKNYTSLVWPGTGANVVIDSIKFNGIRNLPSGLSMSHDEADATYDPGQLGCIHISGTTNDPLGRDTTDLELTAFVTLGGQPVSIDTVSSALGIAPIFIIDSVSSIKELNTIHSFKVSPNPMANTAVITFSAEKSQQFNFSVHDLTGKLVVENNITSTAGLNTINFNRLDYNIEAGIYFLSLSDGDRVAGTKLIITD